MKIGDKVRVTFRSTQFPNDWYGDEGVIVDKYKKTGNFQIRITKKVGTEHIDDEFENWGEGELELISDDYHPRVRFWKEFFGIP